MLGIEVGDSLGVDTLDAVELHPVRLVGDEDGADVGLELRVDGAARKGRGGQRGEGRYGEGHAVERGRRAAPRDPE